MAEELIQIGEFAKRANTNLRTLRYYEEVGLIQPTEGAASRFRFYHNDQVRRVAAIKRLQALGLSLKEIQETMVAPSESQENPTDRLAHSLDRQLDLMASRLLSLQSEHDELAAARTKLNQCQPCEREIGSEACIACTADEPEVYSLLRALN